MGKPSDRRQPPSRRQASLFVGSDQEPLPFGRTRDLSLSGVFLETSSRPALGELRELTLAWGEDVVECQAKVVRHDHDGIALVFIDADTFFIQAIEEIMATSPVVDLISGEH